jgi:hypothetical protein
VLSPRAIPATSASSDRTTVPRATRPVPVTCAFTPSRFTLPASVPDAVSDPASESRRSDGSVSGASSTPSGSPSASRSMRSASARRAESARDIANTARRRAAGAATTPVSLPRSHGSSTAMESSAAEKRRVPSWPATSPSVPPASTRAPRANTVSVSTRASPFATANRARSRSTAMVS